MESFMFIRTMIYVLLFTGLALFLIWLVKRSSKKKVQMFPAHWHEILIENVKFYSRLESSKQKVFQQRMMRFLSEIYIDSVGTEVEELDKILIAASAIIPVFGFGEWHYNVLTSVVLYPDTFNENLGFNKNSEGRKITGLVGTGQFQKQMILSKKALRLGFANKTDKRNTAIHEFVHLIDKMDGETDGIPEGLMEHQYVIPWLKVMHDEMEAINSDKSDIRQYGGTKQTEFFAVASEYFFERPDLMSVKHPDLYKMMVMCFNQDQRKKPVKRKPTK